MAIKLAFSTVACPQWTLQKVAEQAAAMGYQGVELRTLGHATVDSGNAGLACDPLLSEPGKVSGIFKAAGIEPVCLSTSLALDAADASAARTAQDQIARQLDVAAAIGCPSLRIFGNKVDPGNSRLAVLQRIAGRVNLLAEKAGQLGVQLLFENAGSFCVAKDWWWLLNMVPSPMVGLSWNVANAAAAGETPAVSVPMLNSRIRLAKVKDLPVGQGAGFVQLGDGTVGIELFVSRLCGVGFDGYISVEWDRLWLPGLTPAEDFLPEAHQRLTAWLTKMQEGSQAARALAEKTAAKNAEKVAPKAKPKPEAAKA